MKTFTTSRGVEVTFHGIALLLDKLQDSFRPPDPPTYETELPGTLDPATGKPRTETHILDAQSAVTDEDKAALAAYEAKAAEVLNAYNAAMMRLIYLRGITYAEPAGDAWVAEQSFLGLEVPLEPIERKLHYIETEVIGTPEDIEQIMLGVMEASSVPQATLDGMQAAFRSAMGQSGRNEAGGPAAADANRQSLVLQPPVRAGAGRGQKRSKRQ